MRDFALIADGLAEAEVLYVLAVAGAELVAWAFAQELRTRQANAAPTISFKVLLP